jgi:hypothetical protein
VGFEYKLVCRNTRQPTLEEVKQIIVSLGGRKIRSTTESAYYALSERAQNPSWPEDIGVFYSEDSPCLIFYRASSDPILSAILEALRNRGFHCALEDL